MQSKAPTVDAFLDEQPEERRKDLVALRKIILNGVPRIIETMKYGMPCYDLPDHPNLVAFNAQKHYLAFYIGQVPDDFRARMKAFDIGKGCVRFKRLDAEKQALLEELLAFAVKNKITC